MDDSRSTRRFPAQNGVPLFSRARRSRSGMAVIRADLWDTSLDGSGGMGRYRGFTAGTAGKFLGARNR